jgi:SNF2 family DNA or RNA helicase
VHKVRAVCKLLLTGTPLQNNLRELWSLLTYHYPAYFPDPAPFENAFNLNASQQEAADGAGTNGNTAVTPSEYHSNTTAIQRLHFSVRTW